jgi:pyrroloquinoline-quinone synthase
MSEPPLARAAFEERLRSEGRLRYHDSHPFNERMHAGALSPRELGVWIENRYYYQTRLPIKDALIVAKSEDRAFRREWRQRIEEQDGDAGAKPGGLELWLELAEGAGLERAEVAAFARVLPGVRAACDAYVDFVEGATLVEAVASSLTECFAPELMERRISAWEKHYPWVPARARAYFEVRVGRARLDSRHGLEFVLEHATTRLEQERCVQALVKKCGVLWSLLDAVAAACSGAQALEATA